MFDKFFTKTFPGIKKNGIQYIIAKATWNGALNHCYNQYINSTRGELIDILNKLKVKGEI